MRSEFSALYRIDTIKRHPASEQPRFTPSSQRGSTRRAAAGGAPRMRSRVLLFVFLTVFLDMIGFGVVIPLLPFYVRSMGGSAEIVGVLLGSFSLTQVVATPILGRLSDRYGRRRVIVTSL